MLIVSDSLYVLIASVVFLEYIIR